MSSPRKILWMVAPQVDYGPGGAMEIPEAAQLWSEWIKMAPAYDEIWVSLESHPADHISFASMHLWRKPGQEIAFQGKQLLLNITHCVTDSFGAMISAEFEQLSFAKKFYFGTNKLEEPAYFFHPKELESIELHPDSSIKIVGVNHSAIFSKSVAHLQSLDWNVELITNLSFSPEKNDIP